MIVSLFFDGQGVHAVADLITPSEMISDTSTPCYISYHNAHFFLEPESFSIFNAPRVYSPSGPLRRKEDLCVRVREVMVVVVSVRLELEFQRDRKDLKD